MSSMTPSYLTRILYLHYLRYAASNGTDIDGQLTRYRGARLYIHCVINPTQKLGQVHR